MPNLARPRHAGRARLGSPASAALPISDVRHRQPPTLRRPDELVTAILLIPRSLEAARSSFVKLGARKYLVISIVMVAGGDREADDGTVAAARIAVGACSEVARRLPALEAALLGRPGSRRGSAAAVEPDHLAGALPHRRCAGRAAYRRDAALVLLRRALETDWERRHDRVSI